MDEQTLKKLNEAVDEIVQDEEKYPIDTDLLIEMFRQMRKLHPVGFRNSNVEFFISREETLKNVLNFYKSVDIEYYSEALDFLLQLKKNKSLNIFSSKNESLSEHEKEIVKVKGRNEYDEITCENDIYVSTRLFEKEEENEITVKNKDMIYDSRNIVYEIAHSFDKTKTEGIFPIATNIKNVSMKKEKEYEQVREKIYENNKVRNVFSETTAITFEEMYLKYLKNNTNYPQSTIRNLRIKRFNNLFFTSCICYEYLRLAEIKKDKGYISNDELEEFRKELNLNENYMKMLTNEIIEESEKFVKTKSYAIAGLFVPTLLEQYNEKGAEVLKQYIQAIKDNSIDQVFEILQIEKNENCIETLISNVKKQMESFKTQSNKKEDKMER